MNKELVQGAAQFFKKNKGYHRLFKEIKQKYYGLGRMSGSVSLILLTDEERESLGSLLGMDLSQKDHVTIRLLAVEKALQESKYRGVGLKELLEAYFEEKIETKKEQIQRKLDNWKAFCEQLASSFYHPYCSKWICWAEMCETPGSRRLRDMFDQTPKETALLCKQVCMALSSLPVKGSYQRLPVFAEEVFKDPHALDLNTERGYLFIQALAVIHEMPLSLQTEDITELLLLFGLVRDDISNTVTCAGLLAYQNEVVHPVWDASNKVKEVLQIPLRNLLDLNRIVPFHPNFDKVFVIENPAVFSAILDCIGKHLLPPMICTSGQFRMSSLIVMDKLVQAGVKIWYSGDFNPEGLLMAQRLFLRYSHQVYFWRMDLESYEHSLSDKILEEPRLSKLNRIEAKPLLQVKERMISCKKAGYQELLLKELIGDIWTLSHEK